MSIESAGYWEQRAVRFGQVDRGLPAICSYGMPRLYNEAIDVVQRQALASLLARWNGFDVLDVGCGVGRWSLPLARQGNRVTGLDISPTMVELARRNAERAGLDCRFVVGDVTTTRLNSSFDVVLAVTVLQHVVDDREFSAAIQNLVSHLKPGGLMVLLEVAPTRFANGCDSPRFRARTLSTYTSLLSESGLGVLRVTGVDTRASREILLAAVRSLPRWLGRAFVSAAAPLALPLDLAFGSLFPDACWHKVIVARRAE